MRSLEDVAMAATKILDAWLQPPTAAKRKRAAKVDYVDDVSDKENDGSEESKPPKKKQAKGRPTVTAKLSTDQPKKAPTGKLKTDDAKQATKLYAETLKAIDKRVDDLDKKVKAMSGNSSAITTASYATSAGKHLGAVRKLAALDSILAFNLVLSMADASHTDLDATIKMCGEKFDSSTPTFQKLDEALLPLIEQRAPPIQRADALPEVPKRWKPEYADVGEFKCGYPNKQQRSQIYRQKPMWEKERREARRQRRKQAKDWVAVALLDLKEERKYLEEYGVEGYLPLSIAKLEAFSY